MANRTHFATLTWGYSSVYFGHQDLSLGNTDFENYWKIGIAIDGTLTVSTKPQSATNKILASIGFHPDTGLLFLFREKSDEIWIEELDKSPPEFPPFSRLEEDCCLIQGNKFTPFSPVKNRFSFKFPPPPLPNSGSCLIYKMVSVVNHYKCFGRNTDFHRS